MVEGFNIKYAPGQSLRKVCCYSNQLPPVLTCFQWLKNTPLSVADITLTAYNRMLESVEEFESHLEFVLIPAGPEDKDNFFLTVIQDAVTRYLRVPGHPPGMSGVVSDQDIERDKDDRLCRARMFLRGLTEFEVKPLQTSWKLKVLTTVINSSLSMLLLRINRSWSRPHPCITSSLETRTACQLLRSPYQSATGLCPSIMTLRFTACLWLG
jgi:hypothetical protein